MKVEGSPRPSQSPSKHVHKKLATNGSESKSQSEAERLEEEGAVALEGKKQVTTGSEDKKQQKRNQAHQKKSKVRDGGGVVAMPETPKDSAEGKANTTPPQETVFKLPSLNIRCHLKSLL